MTYEAIITLSLAVLALALKPGPGMMMIMSQTIARATGGAFAFMAGFLVITLAYVLFVIVGFQLVGIDMVFISILMKSMAAVYLIWFGIQGLMKLDLHYVDGVPDDDSLFDIFLGAVVLTISNPLVIVFYAGILPTIVDVNNIAYDDAIIIVSIVLAIEAVVPFLYCVPLALFRKKIPIKFLKGLRVFSSIMMVLIGLYIGSTAITSKNVLSVSPSSEISSYKEYPEPVAE